jgi:uncharacterized protein (DUF58 family)
MAYFPYLPPHAERSADLELKFEDRGQYREDSFGVATRFPFAFLTKTRHVPLQREVLVYPRIEPTEELFQILPLVRGEWESFVRGRGSDLYLIREYMPDDSARHVDWKATAKSGSLKVREFSREDERRLRIVFDNPAAGLISGPAYERAVNLAASLAWHFSAEHEAEVSFVVPGSVQSHDLHEFLRRLAVIKPAVIQPAINPLGDGKPEPQGLDKKAGVAAQVADVFFDLSSGGLDQYNIVLTARARGSVPTALWNCSYFFFIGEEGGHRSADLSPQ